MLPRFPGPWHIAPVCAQSLLQDLPRGRQVRVAMSRGAEPRGQVGEVGCAQQWRDRLALSTGLAVSKLLALLRGADLSHSCDEVSELLGLG